MIQSLQARFDRLDQALWAAHAKLADAQWRRNYLRRGGDGAAPSLAAAGQELHGVLLSPHAGAFLQAAKACDEPILQEAARRLRACRDKLRVDTDPRVARLVEEVDDEEVAALRDIRAACGEDRTSPRARVAAQGIRDELGPKVEPRLRQLQALRNDRARDLGHASYPAMALGPIGLSPQALRDLLRGAMRNACGLPDSAAAAPDALWVQEELQRRVELHAAALADLDPADALHGFCRKVGCELGELAQELNFDDSAASGWFVIVRPGDFRLALDRSQGGFAGMATALHELGHAFRARHVQPKSFARLVLCPAALDEGVATVFERLADRPQWLTDELGLPAADGRALRAAWRPFRAVRLRLLAAWALLELDTYDDPAGDHQAAYARWLSQATGVDPARAAPYHWAASGHGFFTEDPMYRYGYVLAEALADRVLPQLPRAIGPELIGRILALSDSTDVAAAVRPPP